MTSSNSKHVAVSSDGSESSPLRPRAFPANPFVGLRPFESSEGALFFGRSAQTIELLQRLHDTKFLAVVGSSGCGKSSLIRAGLVPKLLAGFLVEERDEWHIATMKPGNTPLQNLVLALLETFSEDSAALNIRDTADTMHVEGLQAVVEWLRKRMQKSDANLLLVIDQFEEIFRFGLYLDDDESRDGPSDRERRRDEADCFVSIMLGLAHQLELPVYVVMTMRSDFVGECDAFYGLPEAMNRCQYLVPRLTRQQRQEAIENPIRLYQKKITTRLLDRVLNDVGGESDQLPVMQHAMMRTWEKWCEKEDGPIDLNHYWKIGTIKSALSTDAEKAMEGMTEEERTITQRMFQALTQTDVKGRRLRRPVRLSELMAVTGCERHVVLAIIKRFLGDNRSFLTLSDERIDGNPLVDISHESLIRRWGTLRKWVDAEAESKELYLRLAGDAVRNQRHLVPLWSDPALQTALDWWKDRKPNEAWGRRYHPNFALTEAFLKQSEEARARKAAEEERLRNEKALQLIEQERLKARHRGIYLALSVILIIAATSFALYANRLKESARQSQKDAEAGSAALQNALDLVYDLDRQVPYFGAVMRGHNLAVNSAAFSPDDQFVVTASEDGTAHLWEAKTGKSISELRGHSGAVKSAVFSPDGKLIVTVSADQTARLWNAANLENPESEPEQPKILAGHTDTVSNAIFSPDGLSIVTLSLDGTARVWDAKEGKSIAELKGRGGAVSSAAFSRNGLLATASLDGSVRIWNSGSWNESADELSPPDEEKGGTPLKLPKDINSVAFSPDGKFLVTASANRKASIWDVETKQSVRELVGHQGAVNTAVFSPSGKLVVTASTDHTARIWNLKSKEGSKEASVELIGHGDAVISAAFSNDEQLIVTASLDRSARLWETHTGHSIAQLWGHTSRINSVCFSHDNKSIATASGNTSGMGNTVPESADTARGDTTARLWDISAFASGFRVSDVSVRADQENYQGPCPAPIKFIIKITTIGAEGGTVKYRLVRTNGEPGDEKVLVFNSPGSKEVSTLWRFGGASYPVVSGSFYVEILSPQSFKSKEAKFKVECARSLDLLSAPSPTDLLSLSGGTALLAWTSVPSATSYSVELESADLSYRRRVTNIRSLNIRISEIPSLRVRWRVWAVDDTDLEGVKSDWHYLPVK